MEDAKQFAQLRELMRIQAEKRVDSRSLDDRLKLSHEAIERSLELLKRTKLKPRRGSE